MEEPKVLSEPLQHLENYPRVLKKLPKIRKFNFKDMNYAMLHSQFGMADGVSIVMQQVEEVMTEFLQIPKKNISYIVGKAPKNYAKTTQRKQLWHKNPLNALILKNYEKGLTEKQQETIEKEITTAKKEIENYIKKHNIDVLIVHNSCHPVNFISSVALSRYYQEKIRAGEKTPKYILWWHDSHLERDRFKNPHPLIADYQKEGIPGPFVEYMLFINSLQSKEAYNYFSKLQLEHDAYAKYLTVQNHDVIYNTTNLFIDTYEDLESSKNKDFIVHFFETFNIFQTLKDYNVTFDKTIFVLQHTRIVERKRIDFAIEFCYSLLYTLKKRGIYKAMYFLISGYSGDELDKTRHKLELLHKRLAKKYNIDTFILAFAEDHDKHEIPFEEYPRIFAKLGGIATYFSEIEGFGNNLLEVLASGLIPVVYTYPVFRSDIQKYKFKVIALDDFVIDVDAQLDVIEILQNQRKRKIWVNRNLKILKDNFQHQIISRKLRRAILRRRTHK